MRHARPDYNRFQDPAGLIPVDEPVFLIRGQDIAAPITLRYWATAARHHGASQDIIDLVVEHAQEMERWQLAHGAKTPDLPQKDD